MDLEILLSLHSQQRLFVNPRRIQLLEQIREHGSISQGAKAAGISYKSAWDAIKEMNALAERPVLSSETGGKGGGGASLTAYGTRLLKIYHLLAQIEQMAVSALQDEHTSLDSLLSVVARFSLQTSARNQFFATVASFDPNDISRKVGLALPSHQLIYADITASSVARLDLHLTKEVLALIKAPWIRLASDKANIPVTDNMLMGKVESIEIGDEYIEVILALEIGETLCALLAKETNECSWQQGDSAYAHFSPSQVILATLG
ncbi:molybdenum-dependent transcriptional regulator [Oceanisphaera avium]|uniref:Molybdenum-dependent transcriptional regulator n=2 Tax=Oceanisphaera avium TaxID=1903694 RepID=A0A1Y0D0E4_9GAMM|nr:molybdenum-dependent transcriptional regulator [Oceanisphaera avium]